MYTIAGSPTKLAQADGFHLDAFLLSYDLAGPNEPPSNLASFHSPRTTAS